MQGWIDLGGGYIPKEFTRENLDLDSGGKDLDLDLNFEDLTTSLHYTTEPSMYIVNWQFLYHYCKRFPYSK